MAMTTAGGLIFFPDQSLQGSSLDKGVEELFEYRQAWTFVRRRGLLISDDVLWNNAFFDFSKEVGVKGTYLFGLGALKK